MNRRSKVELFEEIRWGTRPERRSKRWRRSMGCTDEWCARRSPVRSRLRSEEHTSELQSPCNLVCRLLLEKKTKRQSQSRHPGPAMMRGVLRCEPLGSGTPGLVRQSETSCRRSGLIPCLFFFFFNDTATTEIYTLSLHDALPILVGMAVAIWQFGDTGRRRFLY